MRAVIVPKQDEFKLEEIPDPIIEASTDVIVKVSATTVCGSDLHVIHGHLGPITHPTPLGHECIGEVVEVGSAVSIIKPGDMVSVPPATFCRSCPTCRSGNIAHCERGGVFGAGDAFGSLPGAQAEYLRVPWADACLSVIPQGVTDKQALAVGDILNTGWTGPKLSITGPGAVVLVFGCGPVGLSAVHTSRLYGPRMIIAVDTLPERLELATVLGADVVLDPTTVSIPEAVMELTTGHGADAIIDAAGAPPTVAAWIPAAAIGARVVSLAVPGGPLDLPLAELFSKNVTVWSGLGDLSETDHMLQLVASGRLDPTPLFTVEDDFGNIEHVIADFDARKPGLVKPFLRV